MLSKNSIEYAFQKKVVNHLKKKGFNCIVQPTSFPEIIAWKPFENKEAGTLALNVEAVIDGKTITKVLIPFFVTMVKCKTTKSLSKKEKSVAAKILKEGRCNSFLVAYGENKKLRFKEFEIKTGFPIIKLDKSIPSYLG